MECEGVSRVWKRSIETRYLRYTQMISDGDSKSLATLNELKPYGEIKVEKHECVGHVQKRVTPKLKAVRASFKRDKADAKKKEKELKDKISEIREKYGLKRARTRKGLEISKDETEKKLKRGRRQKSLEISEDEAEKKLRVLQTALDEIKVPEGQLLDDTIHQLQVYYGNAIRANVGELEKMTDACWAVMYHSLSTDENPCHYCCPRGMDSWCKFQRALAQGDDVPSHHTPTRKCSSDCYGCHTTVSSDLEPYLEPAWRSLCTPELLTKCLLGATQNSNESFNKLVWSRCPKTEYCNFDTVLNAVAQSTIIFNSGQQALVKLMTDLGIPMGPLCTSYFVAKDRDRVQRSQCKMDAVAKKRRQTLQRRDTLAEQHCIAKEGTTYQAGCF